MQDDVPPPVSATLHSDVYVCEYRRDLDHRDKVCQTLRFYSTIKEPTFFTNALGITTTDAPSLKVSPEQAFYIDVIYDFPQNCVVDPDQFKESIESTAIAQEDVASIIEGLRNINQLQGYQRPPRVFSYTIKIPLDVIENNGGAVYIQDVDVVIGLDRVRRQFSHPLCPPRKRYIKATQDLKEVFRESVAYLIIDNQDEIGDRWINVGHHHSQRVRSLTDSTMKSGFYLLMYDEKGAHYQTHYYPINEADKLFQLQVSRKRAQARGDLEEHYKDEMKIQQHENKMIELKTSQLTAVVKFLQAHGTLILSAATLAASVAAILKKGD